MANALYDTGRQAHLTNVTVGAWTGKVDWVTDTIHAVLVDSADYTLDLVNHTNMSQVPAAARVADVALTNKTGSAGTASADNAVFTAVTGDQSEYVILYRNNAGANVDADNLLIALIDTATNLPVTPNGGDITIVWDGGTGRVYRV